MKRYWLTPPDLYERLDAEFHFDFDPCPYPLPPFPNHRDGRVIRWGKMNYVNPPFRKKDGSASEFVRKAIQEAEKGNSSVIVLPTHNYVNLLLDAGAKLRSLGRVRWLEVENLEPSPNPSPITLFYLRGRRCGARAGRGP